ncbi:MAG: hypothetical protein EXR28_04785 [Betaproteobacteria bacterium]|nr:hypothetical protein [Betaproteobacteria bacterium]
MQDWHFLLLANGAVAIGAAIQGTVGFGMNLIALPLLLALDENLAPVPLLIAHLALVMALSSVDWRRIDREALALAMLGAIPGTVLGAAAIMAMSRTSFQLFTLAVLSLGIIVTAMNFHVPRTRLTLGIAGVLSGFCGTSTSVNGPPLALVMVGKSNLPSIRATLATFLLASTLLSLGALGIAGRITEATIFSSAMLLPGVAIGLLLAKFAGRRVADKASPRIVFLVTSILATSVFLHSILR